MRKFDSLQEVMTELDKHDARVEAFYSDPMTDAMYVPVGDFQRDFDRRRRFLLSEIARLTDKGTPEGLLGLDS